MREIEEMRENYQTLKCNFHTHFAETYGYNKKGAMKMVSTYHKMGYDCISLTEHNSHTNLEKELEVQDYMRREYGSGFIIIIGEEFEFHDTYRYSIKDAEEGRECGHLLALFLNKYINYSFEKNGRWKKLEELIEDVHQQKGLVILPHDHLDKYLIGKWFWNWRKKFLLDGWEVGNGAGYLCKKEDGTNCLLSHPKNVINEGYIALSNSDAHDVEQAKKLDKVCHSYLFVKERSVEGVKDALEHRRTVAYCDGAIFGKRKWLDFYKMWARGINF